MRHGEIDKAPGNYFENILPQRQGEASGPLPSQGRQIEIMQHRHQKFDAARIGRIGVEYFIAFAQEDADAMMLAIGEPGLAIGEMLAARPIVVFWARDLLVRGDMEIIV